MSRKADDRTKSGSFKENLENAVAEAKALARQNREIYHIYMNPRTGHREVIPGSANDLPHPSFNYHGLAFPDGKTSIF